MCEGELSVFSSSHGPTAVKPSSLGMLETDTAFIIERTQAHKLTKPPLPAYCCVGKRRSTTDLTYAVSRVDRSEDGGKSKREKRRRKEKREVFIVGLGVQASGRAWMIPFTFLNRDDTLGYLLPTRLKTATALPLEAPSTGYSTQSIPHIQRQPRPTSSETPA